MTEEENRLNGRRLELNKQMIEASRAYWIDGIETPMSRRTEMRAELADIDLQLHRLRAQRMERKTQAIEIRRNSLTNLLSEALEGLGRGDLVVAAKERALQDVKDAGLYEAYKERGGLA